jgi:hypothetical protein
LLRIFIPTRKMWREEEQFVAYFNTNKKNSLVGTLHYQLPTAESENLFFRLSETSWSNPHISNLLLGKRPPKSLQ